MRSFRIYIFHVCLEGLDLRTIVQLLHMTTMLSVVLTLIGRSGWNLLLTFNRNINIEMECWYFLLQKFHIFSVIDKNTNNPLLGIICKKNYQTCDPWIFAKDVFRFGIDCQISKTVMDRTDADAMGRGHLKSVNFKQYFMPTPSPLLRDTFGRILTDHEKQR